MGVDQRNHQIAPGLSPGWFRVFTLLRKEGLLQGKVALEEERDHGEEALMFQSAHRLAYSVQPCIINLNAAGEGGVRGGKGWTE